MAPATRLFLFLFSLILSATSARADWEIISYGNEQYVSARSIKNFYNFTSMTRKDNNVVLENKAIKLQLRIGSQECFMNGVKFIFSDSVVAYKHFILISRTDLSKLIDPVLRPSHITSAPPFRTVIIDPGHGGSDSGAKNQYGTEAGYNLKVSKLVQERLKAVGYNVKMIRESDIFYSLSQRVAIANKHTNAVFISIHFNAGGGRVARGIETFTLSPVGVAHYGKRVKSSDYKVQQGNYQDSANIAFATAVHSSALGRIDVPDRGIKRARFSVLTGIRHPAILLEGGFMSHPFEARLIHSSEYQKNLALGIAEGIEKFRLALLQRKH